MRHCAFLLSHYTMSETDGVDVYSVPKNKKFEMGELLHRVTRESCAKMELVVADDVDKLYDIMLKMMNNPNFYHLGITISLWVASHLAMKAILKFAPPAIRGLVNMVCRCCRRPAPEEAVPAAQVQDEGDSHTSNGFSGMGRLHRPAAPPGSFAAIRSNTPGAASSPLNFGGIQESPIPPLPWDAGMPILTPRGLSTNARSVYRSPHSPLQSVAPFRNTHATYSLPARRLANNVLVDCVQPAYPVYSASLPVESAPYHVQVEVSLLVTHFLSLSTRRWALPGRRAATRSP